MILTMRVNPDLFLDLEPEVTETAAAGLSLRGSQMDATIRGSDGHGKFDLFLSFSPSVNYRQHPSEVHARAAYEANNLTGGQDQRLLTHPSYRSAIFHHFLDPQTSRQIVKERIEDGANEKAALRFPITALSFASISIFPG